jgi:hypothetical protein
MPSIFLPICKKHLRINLMIMDLKDHKTFKKRLYNAGILFFSIRTRADQYRTMYQKKIY